MQAALPFLTIHNKEETPRKLLSPVPKRDSRGHRDGSPPNSKNDCDDRPVPTWMPPPTNWIAAAGTCTDGVVVGVSSAVSEYVDFVGSWWYCFFCSEAIMIEKSVKRGRALVPHPQDGAPFIITRVGK